MLCLALEVCGRLGAIGCIERVEVALDALFDLLLALLHFAWREVAIAGVDRLELAAVDGDYGLREQLELAAQLDEAAAHVADADPVVVPEVGDGLEVRRQAPGQPHQFDIALGFALEPAAGLDAVEVAVDVDLEQDRRVVGRPARRRGCRAFEAQSLQVELVDERIDDAHRVVFTDVVVKSKSMSLTKSAIRLARAW